MLMVAPAVEISDDCTWTPQTGMLKLPDVINTTWRLMPDPEYQRLFFPRVADLDGQYVVAFVMEQVGYVEIEGGITVRMFAPPPFH